VARGRACFGNSLLVVCGVAFNVGVSNVLRTCVLLLLAHVARLSPPDNAVLLLAAVTLRSQGKYNMKGGSRGISFCLSLYSFYE